MFLCQVVCWPPQGLFQLLIGSSNKARRGRRSSDMRSTCPSHQSLWWCNCSTADLFLDPKTLYITPVLLLLCSHQILLILRRQRWSNTDSLRKSAFSGQVYEPYNRTERTAAEYTLLFVDNLMSFRLHRWYKLEKAGRAFWMREDNPLAILPSGVMWLPK